MIFLNCEEIITEVCRVICKILKKLCVLTYIYIGGLNEGSSWVNVVVQDDDADHHAEAE